MGNSFYKKKVRTDNLILKYFSISKHKSEFLVISIDFIIFQQEIISKHNFCCK